MHSLSGHKWVVAIVAEQAEVEVEAAAVPGYPVVGIATVVLVGAVSKADLEPADLEPE